MMKKVLPILLAVLLVLPALPLGVAAQEEMAFEMAAFKTGVMADSVANYDGYASLRLNGEYEEDEDGMPRVTKRPQTALMSSEINPDGDRGTLLFPYITSYHRYVYSDGVVSLTTPDEIHWEEDDLLYYDMSNRDGGYQEEYNCGPRYYDLEGNLLIELTDSETGTRWIQYTGGYMMNGYAVVCKLEHENETDEDVFTRCIMDKDGNMTPLPEEYNDISDTGVGGYDAKLEIGPFSDGLAAVHDINYYMGGRALLGYIDPSGEMVLKIAGNEDLHLSGDVVRGGPFVEDVTWIQYVDGLFGYMGRDGNESVSCDYKNIYPMRSGVGVVQNGMTIDLPQNKYGAVDRDGNVVIPFLYDGSFGVGDDGSVVMCKDGKYGILDKNNYIIVPFEYDDLSVVEDGVAYGIKDGEVYCLLEGTEPAKPGPTGSDDPDPQEAVELEASKTDVKADAVVNCDGYASLRINGEAEYDETGEWITKVISKPQSGLMDREGKMLFPYIESYYRYVVSDGVVSLTSDDATWYMTDEFGIHDNEALTNPPNPKYYDLEGNLLMELESTEAAYMIDGYTLAVKDGKSYIMDREGNMTKLADEKFDQYLIGGVGGYSNVKTLGQFFNGIAPVIDFSNEDEDGTGRAVGYMDTTGEMVLDFVAMNRYYANAGEFMEDAAWVTGWDGDMLVGYIDREGNEIIPCMYHTAFPMRGGTAAVKNGKEKYGAVDRDNETIIPFLYDDCFGAGDDGSVVMGKDGKYGILDKNNNIIVPFEYDDLSAYDNGVAYGIKDGELYILLPGTKPAQPGPEGPGRPAEPTPTPGITFTDVPENQYYYNPVMWAVANGITGGTGGGKFSPNMKCTRAQIVTFLWNFKGKPEPAEMAAFADMTTNVVFNNAISWAVEQKITGGIGNNKFGPGLSCTRGQAMVFLWIACGKPEPLATATFSDMPKSEVFRKAISWGVENKITGGTGNNKFSPNAPCTRAQIVTFLYAIRDM